MADIDPAMLDRQLVERVEDLVDVTGGPGACWPWRGSRLTSGYGRITHRRVAYRAHRLAFALSKNTALTSVEHLDHLCHTQDGECLGGNGCPHRACCNPTHLEVVTLVENVMRGRSSHATNARKTHCVHGHELTPGNVTATSRGGRRCNTCAGITGRGQGYHGLKTHCLRGHRFTPENTRMTGRSRACRTCHRDRARVSYRATHGLPPE